MTGGPGVDAWALFIRALESNFVGKCFVLSNHGTWGRGREGGGGLYEDDSR